MTIQRQALLTDLQKLLQRIEADLLERSESTEVPEVPAALHAEYEKAAKAERTAQNYEDWRTDTNTQAAAAWVLSCVFVRFLEDNSLIDPPRISGQCSVFSVQSGGKTENRLERARDEHELYFRKHPQHTDREYLLSIFDDLKKLPGTRDLFNEFGKQMSFQFSVISVQSEPETENCQLKTENFSWLSGDAAGELLNFFQKIDASKGNLVHDFTDANWDTRFLGDLYQDLSESARKKFALLQTPDFVEEFILDRTLEPALEEFGLVPSESGSPRPDSGRGAGGEGQGVFKMIDPACGSGHFLLGTFPRLLDRWQRKEPGTNVRELAQRALNSIHGVDINPFAVAIAKFRLLLVAMKACDIRRLADAPAFQINVACGDSLLHGENRTSTGQRLMDFAEGATDEELYSHAYPGEDLQTVRSLLKPATYHCVVANPPYIVPKDRKLNDWYRKRFSACHRQYSLAVPFMQQIFQLAVHGGFTGQITANSFMKREFGKTLIETFFPTVDLSHVIDTSGAFIPGHGTPTTILFGRNREYVGSILRTVLGIRGEPSTPDDPSRGLVWSSIVNLVDQTGEQNEFVSSGDSDRALFHKHPWSIGGGGATELKESLDGERAQLGSFVDAIGFYQDTHADEAFVLPPEFPLRHNLCFAFRQQLRGDNLRDWIAEITDAIFFPYDEQIMQWEILPLNALRVWLYGMRTELWSRSTFGGGTYRSSGRPWFDYHQFPKDRARSKFLIGYAEIATHNHFVLDRGAKVFNRTAPVIKLPSDVTEDDHLALLGLLNSSTACFWMRQSCHNKGGGASVSKLAPESWENFYWFNGTNIEKLPLPEGRPLGTAKHLDQLAQKLTALSPANIFPQRRKGATEDQDSNLCASAPLRETLSTARKKWNEARALMIAGQEDLDWECYKLYQVFSFQFSVFSEDDLLASDDCPPLTLGQRAFEIVLARKIAAGEAQSTWFERHGSTPIRELPNEWPDDYKKLVERRIELIENDPNIRLIEQPEYKRRWNTESWESQLERALREWLLLRLETYLDFDGRMSDLTPRREDAKNPSPPAPFPEAGRGEPELKLSAFAPLREISVYSVAQLADAARRDPQFMEVGELYRNDPAFDVQTLVQELVLAESVPHLPILRYKDTGLRKRAEWEKTWDLQRREDDIDAELKSAQECMKLAEQCVREKFKHELEVLGRMRARLLEATTQAYIDLGQEVPSYEPQYEAEIHAGVLLNHNGVKTMATAMALNSAKDEVMKYQRDLDHKIRLARDEDVTVLKCHNRLREIPDKPEIMVPPKYISADFISTGGARYWSLRGKLDVPKERWLSFPHCEGPDGTLVICWAGYDHLQQAQAISAYYVRVQTEFGGSDDPRLIPLLASLIELLPWLAQWHNEPNANFDGLRMGDYFEGFVNEEARNLGKTLAEIKAWVPVKKVAKNKSPKSKKKSAQVDVEAGE